MNKPVPPVRPNKKEPKLFNYIGLGANKKQIIYSDIDILNENYNLEEHNINYDDNLKQNELPYDKITLQDVLDLAPKGATLSDIKLSIYFPRMLDYMQVSFVYQKRNEAEEKKYYELSLLKYEEEMFIFNKKQEQYKKDLIEYNKWEKEQEIKELEAKLEKLKNG